MTLTYHSPLKLNCSVQRGRLWTRIDADYSRDLHGAAAERAGQLVIEGIEATLAADRRTDFWVSIGCLTAQISPKSVGYTELIMKELRGQVGKSGCLWVTVCPRSLTERFVEEFEKLTKGAK